MRVFSRKEILTSASLGLIFFNLPASAQWTNTGCSPSGSYCLTSGNAGIGTANPQGQLHILGNGADTNVVIDALQQQSWNPLLSFREQSVIVWNLGIDTNDSYKFKFAAGVQWDNLRTAPLMTITGSGNVGIGTSNPASVFRLHTVGPIASDEGSNRFVTLGLDPGASSSPTTYAGMYLDANQNLRVEALSGGVAWRNIVLQGQGSGNVGIGTTNPQSKLAVNGTITTQEVVVTATGWSDYVFDKDHHLAPLTDVASFIKENHHLPGIPSAAEVAEKGVSVGEMQARLLAKIEELTLHMIDEEKRNRQVEQENQDLRRRIESLESDSAQRREQ